MDKLDTEMSVDKDNYSEQFERATALPISISKPIRSFKFKFMMLSIRAGEIRWNTNCLQTECFLDLLSYVIYLTLQTYSDVNPFFCPPYTTTLRKDVYIS